MDRKTPLMQGLKKFKKSISTQYPVEKMIFFGSRVLGKAHQESDIDLIVVSPTFKGMKFFRRPVKLYDHWKLKYPVDFLCYTPQEFAKKSKQISIVGEAVKTGVNI